MNYLHSCPEARVSTECPAADSSRTARAAISVSVIEGWPTIRLAGVGLRDSGPRSLRL
jgi:hypothetical protein